jgi:murein L,D-transpeptidase YcbB/YkuD
MYGRSFVAVSVAGVLALVYAVLVPVASVAEDVATAEQPAIPTGAATPSQNAVAPTPSPANAVAPATPVPPQTEAAAPAPAADPVIASIRSKLADAALRKGADPADLAALDAFYAERSGPPVWVTPMGFSARAQAAIDEIGKADDWGLQASAFQLPPAGTLPKTADEQAVAEIKLQLAVLKYARFARGGRVNPASLSKILDLDPPIRDPKIVLAEISASPGPDL